MDIWGEYAKERSGSGYIGFAVPHQARHFLRVFRPAYGYLAEELLLLRLHHLDTEVTAHIEQAPALEPGRLLRTAQDLNLRVQVDNFSGQIPAQHQKTSKLRGGVKRDQGIVWPKRARYAGFIESESSGLAGFNTKKDTAPWAGAVSWIGRKLEIRDPGKALGRGVH